MTRYYAVMNIIFRYIEICLFKASPADVPNSLWLMKMTLFFYFVVSVLITQIEYGWKISLFSSLAEMMVTILVAWLLLQFRGFTARFQQTVTSLAGIGICFGILGTPIFYLVHMSDQQGLVATVASLFILAVLIWSLMVTAHVFRMALEIKPSTAMMITVAYTILTVLVAGLAASGVA
jgi:hypothetical protein